MLAVTRKVNIQDFNEARDNGVAVASTGPYANLLHLASDMPVPHGHHSVFTSRMSFLLPNQKHQGTEA